ncbi:MAG: formylmethanofuran dehydrogenase [Hyphomicrobiales bacterium]
MPGRRQGRHPGAWIEGNACPLDEAIEVAACRLRGSRQVVFAGLGCDIEGVRAVVRLARRTGGAIDHLGGTGYAFDLEVMRDAGLFLTTPGEAKARADTLFIVGPRAFATEPDLLQRLLEAAPMLAGTEAPRRVAWLGGKLGRVIGPTSVEITSIGVPAAAIGPTLAALRARLAGRPIGSAPLPARRLDSIVEALRHARFGVAIWSCADLDLLTIDTLAGLVADLNHMTRFSCLPVAPPDNGAGVAMAMTWLTGFPSNIGFARGEVDHDPWRFDAARLARSGEVDLALWISAYRDTWPDWASEVPVIALTSRDSTREERRASIEIEVGRPGADHDTVDLSAATGSLAFRAASAPDDTPSVAEIIGAIQAAHHRAGEVGR